VVTVAGFDVQRIDAPFGAAVTGCRFDTADPAIAATVNSLLLQHHILVFPDLPGRLAHTELNDFFAHLGTLSEATSEVIEHWKRLAQAAKVDVDGEALHLVSNQERDGRPAGLLGDAELDWHNDHAPLARVKKIAGLQGVEVDAGAPPTMFCDMYAALDTLPAALRHELADRVAVHRDFALAAHRDEQGHQSVPPVMHPVLKRHPDSGRTALFVNLSTTDHIVGLSEERNRQLLDDIFGHAYQSRFTYAHEWQPDVFVVWDNIGLQHRRDSPQRNVRRTLFRFPGVAE
jgi:alpha-ketoglutarate-dependent taurine dioxygenase